MSRVASAPTKPSTVKPPAPNVAKPVTHEQIAARAYEKWIKKGRPAGTHVQDWLEAEAELKREPATGATQRR